MRPLLIALLCTGCFDFEAQEKVLDLRALTAVADPPEIMVVVGQDSSSDTLFKVVAEPPPTTISLLVVNPQAPDVPLRIGAAACLANELRKCDRADGPVLELGRFTRPTGRIDVPFGPSAAQLNDWLAVDPFQGFGGLYVLVVFTIEQAGFPPDRVAKLVTYNVPFVPQGEGQDPPPPKVANRNPRLDALLVGDALRTEAMGFSVAPGEKVDLEPVFNRAIAIEDYPVINFPDRGSGDLSYSILTEKLEFQFYTTAGKFGSDKLETRNVLGEKDEIKTSYTAPDPFDEPATVWVITRDDRGGGSWTTWTVTPGPP